MLWLQVSGDVRNLLSTSLGNNYICEIVMEIKNEQILTTLEMDISGLIFRYITNE